MREQLTTTCEADSCERPLAGSPAIEFEDPDGVRRVYECPCGAVTVTVVRE